MILRIDNELIKTQLHIYKEKKANCNVYRNESNIFNNFWMNSELFIGEHIRVNN